QVDISNNGGVDWVSVERVTESAPWTEVTFRVLDYTSPTSLMAVRFVAQDVGSASTVEAAIDDFAVYALTATDVRAPSPRARLLPVTPNPFNPT
ncbi:MAG: hypothetical protein GWN29_09665, partial [Gammaproteobacteria bacterium]|nr:hypothetical protein [Gammaproteobacteria bacterium]